MSYGVVCGRSGRHTAKCESQGAGGGIPGVRRLRNPRMSEHILTRKHKHHTHTHATFGWRIHCGVEVTELSTNKQQSLNNNKTKVYDGRTK